MDPGDRIKKVREEADMTRTQLSRSLGLNYGTLTRWETGRTLVPYTSYKKIMAYFNIDVVEVKEFLESKKRFEDE